MVNFESLLFEVAPWTQEVMQEAKRLNQGSFLRGRTGWIRRDVKNAESIYEHSCKVGLAAYYLFGTEEAVAQGVVHDFAEIFEEDYIPGEICINDKTERELAVMKQLKDMLPNGDYWFNVWNRFENQIEVGKHIVELDKICPAIQAVDYSKINYSFQIEDTDKLFPIRFTNNINENRYHELLSLKRLRVKGTIKYKDREPYYMEVDSFEVCERVKKNLNQFMKDEKR